MDLTEYLDRVRATLSARGFEVSRAQVAGRPVIAARRSDFRWRWFAVRLHTSVIVGSFGAADARRDLLDGYLDAASRWAVQHNRGRVHGLQSGTAALAVAVVSGEFGEARAWASTPHGRRFAELAYPVAVDHTGAIVVQPQRMIVGGIFIPFLRDIVHDTIEDPLASP
jgi:hypothetical protein